MMQALGKLSEMLACFSFAYLAAPHAQQQHMPMVVPLGGVRRVGGLLAGCMRPLASHHFTHTAHLMYKMQGFEMLKYSVDAYRIHRGVLLGKQVFNVVSRKRVGSIG